MEEKEEERKQEEKKKGKLERSHSMKAGKSNKEKGKGESLGRTASLRYGDDKAKQVIKDINLRTSEAHQDKDKGRVHSLLLNVFVFL